MSQVEQEKRTKSFPETEIKNSSISDETYYLINLAVDEEISSERNNETLKEYWIKIGNQLEIDGVPKQEICTTASKLIIKIKSGKLNIPEEEVRPGSWFYEIYKKQGWVNINLGRPRQDEPDETIENPKTKYEIENQCWRIEVRRMKDILDDLDQKLKNEPFDSLLPRNISDQTVRQLETNSEYFKEMINKKIKIKPIFYSQLIKAWFGFSGKKLANLYYTYVQEKVEFVEKQYRKPVKALMREMPAEFEPQNEDHAKACDFSGVPCPACHCLRTHYVPAIKVIVEKDWNGTDLINEKGEPITKKIAVKKIHCYKCEKDHDAPAPRLPAIEISATEW